jgi:hypothetical protein
VPEIPESNVRTKRTSYTRKQGDFSYDIEVYDPPNLLPAGRFYATVLNIVRRASGETISVTAEISGEYGATPDEALSKIDAAVLAWVRQQSPHC